MTSTDRRFAVAPLAALSLAASLLAAPLALVSAGPALAQAKDNAVPADAAPKTDAAVAAAVKKNGFASVEDFANTSFSIGMVLAGVDPQTKQYVGVDAVTKKQMSEIQADTTMSAKDKKDALDELGAASKQTPTVKPIEGNITLVTKNYDALNTALQTDTQ